MKEIEFVCCNPDFDDATSPEAQSSLMHSLRTVPGLATYRQDWGDGQTSLATVIRPDAPRHAEQTIRRLAKRHGVQVDLINEVEDRHVDELYDGTKENVTHFFHS